MEIYKFLERMFNKSIQELKKEFVAEFAWITDKHDKFFVLYELQRDWIYKHPEMVERLTDDEFLELCNLVELGATKSPWIGHPNKNYWGDSEKDSMYGETSSIYGYICTMHRDVEFISFARTHWRRLIGLVNKNV